MEQGHLVDDREYLERLEDEAVEQAEKLARDLFLFHVKTYRLSELEKTSQPKYYGAVAYVFNECKVNCIVVVKAERVGCGFLKRLLGRCRPMYRVVDRVKGPSLAACAESVAIAALAKRMVDVYQARLVYGLSSKDNEARLETLALARAMGCIGSSEEAGEGGEQ